MSHGRAAGAIRILSALVPAALAACDGSSPPPGPGGPAPQAHCVHFSAERQPFFGDLHVHTKYSLDANTQGTIITPHEAYRFARGERLGIQPYDENGVALRHTRLARPLDFAAVTDHAELFGEVEICTNPDYVEYNLPECQFYRSNPEQAFLFFNLAQLGVPGTPHPDGTERVQRLPYCGVNGAACLEAAKTPWRDIQMAAEAFYDRSPDCRFTTIVGYEWTGSPQSNNLHRNVLFGSEVVPAIPPAYQETPAPEYLWQALAAQCRAADGCSVLTIPHNSNLSAGLMFRTTDDKGNAYTREFAALRQANEPLAEIMQHKGQSECLGTTGAGAQDELCDFEILPYNNLTGDRFGGFNTGPPKEQDFLREALKEGLRLDDALGANPFKYGFVGSSDTHLGTAGGVRENDWPGHGGAGLNPADAGATLSDVIESNPGGLAVLWAEQNTRESLFAAMRRREAYATSGTRPTVRFFGGWDLPADHCARADFAGAGYAGGVPMGGDLAAAPAAGRAPHFTVAAQRDPGAPGEPVQPLQRLQIVKGWVENGAKREQVFEVAGDAANGAGVDLATCEPTGTGFASLCASWQDPDFDPAESAFYYARVIENPSCRWSTRQCLAAAIDCSDPDAVPEGYANCCNADYPKTVQERAWTSPIWYRRPDAP